jgi:hypothetical protein
MIADFGIGDFEISFIGASLKIITGLNSGILKNYFGDNF